MFGLHKERLLIDEQKFPKLRIQDSFKPPVFKIYIIYLNRNYSLTYGIKFPPLDPLISVIYLYLFLFLDRERITTENVAMGILFSQTAKGILGNWSLLLHYFILIFTEKRLMLNDLIIKHLIFANFLVIISRRIPQIVSEFGLNFFLDYFICKLGVYFSLVPQGIFLCTICLLSCFQAITTSSSTRWMKLKHRAIQYIGLSSSLSLFVHLILNIPAAVSLTGPHKSRNGTNRFSFGYCAGFVSGTDTASLYLFLLCFSDGLYLCLMVWTSVTMVCILHKHKREGTAYSQCPELPQSLPCIQRYSIHPNLCVDPCHLLLHPDSIYGIL